MGFVDKVKKASSGIANRNTAGEEPSAPVIKRDKKVEDILEVLQISPTFEIPAEVFLPDDLKDISFDIQVPQGYDIGQVMRFVHQTRNSISFLTELLKKRNIDIAKLATTIDRLKVDVNNLRFESEIANGINIVPTGDDADLENQLTEARLTIRRLEDQLKNASNEKTFKTLPSADNAAYNSLLDEVSLLKRKNQTLEEEKLHYKSMLAAIEEDSEAENFTLPQEELSPAELRDLGLTLDSFEEEPLVMPSLTFDEIEEEQEEYQMPDLSAIAEKPREEEKENSTRLPPGLVFPGITPGAPVVEYLEEDDNDEMPDLSSFGDYSNFEVGENNERYLD